jgi:hypothetical protein
VVPNLFSVLDPEGKLQDVIITTIKAFADSTKSIDVTAVSLLKERLNCSKTVFQAMCDNGMDVSDLAPDLEVDDDDLDAELRIYLYQKYGVRAAFPLDEVLLEADLADIVVRIPLVKANSKFASVSSTLALEAAKQLKTGTIWTSPVSTWFDAPLIACMVADFQHKSRTASITSAALEAWTCNRWEAWDRPFEAQKATLLHLLAQGTQRTV